MQETAPKEGKERLRLFAILTILVSVLVAGTTLWNFREKLPDWWFQTTLAVLLLIVVILVFNTMSPFSSLGFKQWREKRKRDGIARKCFPEFKNLVYECRIHDYSIKNIENTLYQHYKHKVTSLVADYVLQGYNETEIESSLYSINEELREMDETFSNLYLMMKRVESILGMYRENLNIIQKFVNEITISEKSMTKGIESEFEHFREKYNDFLNRFKGYCQRVNREIGEQKFPERIFEIITKW
jgi:hypothetical protein